jgi:hypothetical protein
MKQITLSFPLLQPALRHALAKSLAVLIALTAANLAAATAGAASIVTFDDVGLVHGSLVSDQYPDLAISATNFTRGFHLAVAFDSNASGTRDPDLEAADGGPPFWSGGNIADQDLGLMLIIQENDEGCLADAICDEPDDEGRRAAGTITIEFTRFSVIEFGFDIVDVESLAAENGSVTLHDGASSVTVGFASLLSAPQIGDNTANRIAPLLAAQIDGIEEIDKVVIELGGSGAIDNLTFSHVPEPSTLLLSALGLAGLGAARRVHRTRGR